ncbi:MAG: hypothetical protein M1337_06200 [Actinobacteria bacterium]|nr:hypothetical protein [Actinomycetota bacterium]
MPEESYYDDAGHIGEGIVRLRLACCSKPTQIAWHLGGCHGFSFSTRGVHTLFVR